MREESKATNLGAHAEPNITAASAATTTLPWPDDPAWRVAGLLGKANHRSTPTSPGSHPKHFFCLGVCSGGQEPLWLSLLAYRPLLITDCTVF